MVIQSKITDRNGKTPYGKGVEFGEKGISESKWCTQHSLLRNADVYPTNGLGPIATMNDINRGNRFLSMTSHATKSVGLNKYIKENGDVNHPNAKLKWKQGDIITANINTANGETITVAHDVNSPRPYSLDFSVQGSQGIAEFDYHTQRIHIEGITKKHQWESMEAWLKKYGDYASNSGHGGMDFFVLNAFVESAKQNIAPPMPQRGVPSHPYPKCPSTITASLKSSLISREENGSKESPTTG